jgi:hypothetical protein
MACADENARQVSRLLPKVEVSLSEVFAAYETISAGMVNPKN